MLKKLKVKKFVKICSYIILILGFILLFTELALRYLLPLPSVKTKILNQISSAIGAKLNAENISAGFFGVEIDNVTLDTDKENLIVVKNIKIMQNPFKVLKGQLSVNHIYINEPVLQIIRYKDGSFNFDPLLSSSQTDPKAEKKEKTSSGVPLDLRIKSCTISFSFSLSRAISTIPTAPSTIILRASIIAEACCLWSMTEAISGAYARYVILASIISSPASSTLL